MTGPPITPGTSGTSSSPSTSSYDALLDQDEQKTQLQQSGYVASQRPDPARWAKVLELSNRTKLPADVVDRNFDSVRAGVESQQTDYDQLIQSSPGLAQWLAHPDNATLAKQEHEPLTRVDQGVRALGALNTDPLVSATRQLVGGSMPAVVNSRNPAEPQSPGEYTAPSLGTKGDTLYLGQDANAPTDFVFSHEMGHRLYFANDTLGMSPDVRPSAYTDPQLQQIVAGMQQRYAESAKGPSEAFAQAFSEAARSVYGSAAYGADSTSAHRADPADVAALAAWIKSRGIQPSAPAGAPAPSGGSGFFGAIPAGYNDLATAAGHLAAAYGLTSPDRAAQFVAEKSQRAAQFRANAPDYAKAYDAANAGAANRDAILQVLADASGNAAPLAGEVLDKLQIAARHPLGFARDLLQGLVGSAPALATGAAGAAVGSAVAPGVGTAVGLGAGTFAGLAPLQVGQEIGAELQRRGVDPSDPAALARAYRDPAFMATIRRQAERKGITTALVSSLVASLGGQLTAEAKAAGVSGLALAKPIAQDAAIQAAGQAAATGAGQVAAGQPVDVGAMVETGLSQLGFALGDVAVGAGMRSLHHPETATAAAEVVDRTTDALRAQHDANALAQVGQAVQDAPTTASVPDRLRDLVNVSAGGEDASHVYFQTDQWDKYWSDRGRSPAQAAAQIMGDDGRGYDAARATGTVLAIPLGDYASKVAPDAESFGGLLPIARTRPDGASLAEAHEYLQALPGTLRDLTNEALAARVPAGTEPNASSVASDVQQQLQAAGVSESAAKAQATLYDAAFRTLGQRAGVDPLELYKSYQLSIHRGLVTDRIAQATANAETARAAVGDEFTPSAADEAAAAKPIPSEPRAPDQPSELAAQDEAESGPIVRARTPSGRLKSLKGATDEEIRNEYRLLIDQNAEENTAPTVTGALPTDYSDGVHTSMRQGAMRAMGRVVARAKSIAKLEAEMERRGIDPADAYFHSAQDAKALEPEAFPFGANQFGQAAYHGSPHTFDEFSLHKIGTGEGVQAYGWGLYFAGRKSIAHFYREQLTRPRAVHDFSALTDAENRTLDIYSKPYISRIGALEIDSILRGGLSRKPTPEEAAALTKLRDSGNFSVLTTYHERGPGRLYHVDIPEDDAMLDWDKPMSEQPPTVRGALERMDVPMFARWKETGAWEHVTGKDMYEALAEHFGTVTGNKALQVLNRPSDAEAASRELAARGVAGIKYLDATSRHTGGPDASHNYVVFDDKLVKIMQYEQASRASANEPRGRITFGPNGVNIDLLRTADRSTFLHETGHLYLHLLDDLATRPGAAEGLAADRSTIRDWLGAAGDDALTREQHEQFARGFEAYLMEGKAPSPELRGAFYRFKTWLTGVYRNLRALNVTLTPEVRSVFDRLLASQDEIRAVEQSSHAQPLFDDPAAVGLKAPEIAAYQKAVDDAHQSAEEALTASMMKEVRREESKQWDAWREPIRADVERETNKSPVYRALEYLKSGKTPDGEELPAETPRLKLNRQAVKDMGDRAAALLKRGVTATDGADPDVVAEMFGFNSGTEMVEQLAAAPTRKNAIDAETDRRMQAEHGERMSDAQVYDKAIEAVHGEKRAQLLRKELEILASDHLPALKGLVRAISKTVPPSDVVRAEASRLIGTKTVRELRPDLLAKAADRLGAEARDALLKGDIQGAFDAKQKELLATETYREAVRAKGQIDDAITQFRKVFKADAKIADTRDMDLVNAARSILASFGIGSSDKTPADYLEQIRRYDPETAEDVEAMVRAATQRATPYKDLSIDDFRAMHDAVDGLWSLARRSRQIEVDGQRLDRHEVQDALAQRLHVVGLPDELPGYRRAVTRLEGTKMQLLGVKASLRHIEHWVRAVDGGAHDGVFRRYLWNPIREATTAYRLAYHDAVAKYADVAKGVDGKITRNAIPAPELNYTFKGHNELLGAMLHTGNESNLRKLLLGRHWGTLREDDSVDTTAWDTFVQRMQREGTLAKPHYDYLQGVWNLLESLKPDAQRAHKALTGRYFDEITAQPFATPYGRYEGGYYPAKADPELVPDQAINRERDALLGNNNSFMFPTTGRGFTKTRVEYNRPLILDASAVPSAFSSVLKFTHIEPHVRDVARVVTGHGFRDVLNELDPKAGGEMLTPWLQRAATQATEVKGHLPWLDKATRELRNRSGMQVFAANMIVVAEQITHFPAITVRVPPGHLIRALWSYTRDPRETAATINEASPFMRTRESAALMEARQSIQKILLDPTIVQSAHTFFRENSYALMRGVQSVMDHVAWSAAYDHATEQGMVNREAVRHADATIREVMGSFAPEDLSRFETGTPTQKLFSMAYSFYNTKLNLLGTEAQLAKSMGLRKGAGRALYVYTVGLLIPAVLGYGIKQALMGKPVEGDDEDASTALARYFGLSQLEMGERMVPFLGPLADVAISRFTGSPPADVLSSPAVKAITDAAKSPGDAYHAINDGLTDSEVNDFLTLIGLLSNTPARALGKPIIYIRHVMSGDAGTKGPVDFARGILTGASR